MFKDPFSKPYDCFSYFPACTKLIRAQEQCCLLSSKGAAAVAVKDFGQTWQPGRMLAVSAALCGCLWVRVLVDTSSISAILSLPVTRTWGNEVMGAGCMKGWEKQSGVKWGKGQKGKGLRINAVRKGQEKVKQRATESALKEKFKKMYWSEWRWLLCRNVRGSGEKWRKRP